MKHVREKRQVQIGVKGNTDGRRKETVTDSLGEELRQHKGKSTGQNQNLKQASKEYRGASPPPLSRNSSKNDKKRKGRGQSRSRDDNGVCDFERSALSSWSTAEPTGGRFLDVSAVFTPDEEYVTAIWSSSNH